MLDLKDVLPFEFGDLLLKTMLKDLELPELTRVQLEILVDALSEFERVKSLRESAADETAKPTLHSSRLAQINPDDSGQVTPKAASKCGRVEERIDAVYADELILPGGVARLFESVTS